MRRGTALVLVAAVTLAGCGAVDTGGPPGGETPTLTPAPVPEATGPAGGRPLGPGLSTRGVFDPAALAESHRTSLTERGFVLTRNRTVFRPNGSGGRTLNSVEIRAVVEPGAEAYRFTRVERSSRQWPIADTYALIGVWYSEPVVRNRFVDDGPFERYWGQDRAASGGPVRDPTRSGSLRSDVEAVDLRVVGNESDEGTRVYRLRGSRISSSAALVFPPLLSAPRNASMVAGIDERGVVRSYRLTFDATFDGGPVRVRRTHRLSNVGNTTVDRPGWLSEANVSVGTAGG